MATELHEQGTQARSYMDQPEKERTLQFVTGGASFEAIAGIGTVVLAILGLTGILPLYMTSIAVIVAGAGLLFGGGTVASRMRYLRSHAISETKFAELSGGTSAEFLGGVAGVVLGILSLVGIVPAVLLPVAAITFGGALLIGTGAMVRLNEFPAFTGGEKSEAEMWSREAAISAAGAQVFVGLASIVLGILALVHFAWITLTLVALICVAGSTLLSGAALTSRMQSVLHHHVYHW